jgi:hypothetical protein
MLRSACLEPEDSPFSIAPRIRVYELMWLIYERASVHLPGFSSNDDVAHGTKKQRLLNYLRDHPEAASSCFAMTGGPVELTPLPPAHVLRAPQRARSPCSLPRR